MPYTTTYVDDGKGVHKTASGIVTGLDIFTSALHASRDGSRAQNLCYGLFDFSDTTELKVTPDDIRRIVEMNRKLAALIPGALIAVVAPTPLPYAMARLWHTLSDDLQWKSNVFHNRADAIAWLRRELAPLAGMTDIIGEFPSLGPLNP
jgi:hypothetical protein